MNEYSVQHMISAVEMQLQWKFQSGKKKKKKTLIYKFAVKTSAVRKTKNHICNAL